MYFTREPVIETVITAREGYKLSIRNSKHIAQDPFVVEALEVISLGTTCFFRNCDHSKPFIVPAADYEVMEVRDAKINLKAVGLDRGIKIAGGREAVIKLPKSSPVLHSDESIEVQEDVAVEPSVAGVFPRKEKKERKGEKWKERKKQSRRKSNKEISEVAGSSREVMDTVAEEILEESQDTDKTLDSKHFSLLPPPDKLISEMILQAAEDAKLASNDTSADLEESLQALVTESSEILDSLLLGDKVVVPEEGHATGPVVDQSDTVCEQATFPCYPEED